MSGLSYDDIQRACKVVHPYDKYFTTLCPFHSDVDPSLLVYKDGWFRCLGCDRHGTWKMLWNKLKGQPIQIMPERKTTWDGPMIGNRELEDLCYEAHNDLLKFPSLGWYLEMRGIEDRIERNEIGYWQGWYTFPVYDKDYNFITAVFRSAPHVQKATGIRYWCKHAPTMYVPDWNRLETGEYIVVVYGILDALVLSSIQEPVVTTTGGQDHFNPEWLDEYRKPVYILPDADEEKAAITLANRLGWRGSRISIQYPEGKKDPAGFAELGKKNELAKQLSQLKG